MGVKGIVKRALPAGVTAALARARKKIRQSRIERLPPLSESDFAEILAGPLRLSPGDTVYVHSAADQLSLGFPFFRALPIIRAVVGPRGTILFPTYPNRHVSAYEYLQQGHTFDVRRTPSYTGALTEIARRQPGALRSLHPTKSVCASGPLAEELTRTHHLSPYPFDRPSPYFKLTECGAKIVGLGVGTSSLTLMHAAEDALGEDYPLRLYRPELFAAECIDYAGKRLMVETYAHDPARVARHDVPGYMKKYVAPEACSDLTIRGMKFFLADAALLFDAVLGLSRRGIVIYKTP